MADGQKKNTDGTPGAVALGALAATSGAAPPADAAAGSAAAAPATGGPASVVPAPASAPDANAGSDLKPADAGDAEKSKQKASKDAAAAAQKIKQASAWRKVKKHQRAQDQQKKLEGEESEDDPMQNQPRVSLAQRCCPWRRPGRDSEQSFMADGGANYQGSNRPFEMTLQLTGIQNVLSEDVDAFFCVRINSVKPHIYKNKVANSVQAAYTGARVFHGGENFIFEQPEMMFERKSFRLSYLDLAKHELKVDMWKVSKCTFNTLHGQGRKNLKVVANVNPNTNIFIKKVVKPDGSKKKKNKGAIYDVALFSAFIQLEEIFDFKLRFENFNYEPNGAHKDYKGWMENRKFLNFIVPRNHSSDPMNNRRCNTQKQDWVDANEGGFIWKNARECLFTGTKSQLTASCFMVNVHSANPTNPVNGAQIGKCLLNLMSVLDASVFKGDAKTLSKVQADFRIGIINGNVRLELRSKGMGEFLTQLPLGCPVQPTESGSSHVLLKPFEKHLVVSIAKCDGLPVADPEEGTSDPYLRVSWDNMVKKSWVAKGTTRPVFNQNFYFPVRMFNPKLESKRGGYRKNGLLYELESKGPIQISVWDDDLNSSELLGTFKLEMSDILASTMKEGRTLRGSVKAKDPNVEVDEFATKKKNQWFDKERPVRIFDGGKGVGGTKLVCSQLKPSGNKDARMYFEAYFYPNDWPDDFAFSKNEGKESEKQWEAKEKAWQKDLGTHQKRYKQAFPESIGALPTKVDEALGIRNDRVRRYPCMAETQDMKKVPLPAFLVKIITPEEYSKAPWLLHWMNCFNFSNETKQIKTGLVDRWNDSQMVLFARKGSAQDHAILLCSVLLGTKRDAYVVKGMVWQNEPDMFETKKGPQKVTKKKDEDLNKKLCEHVWVMTREFKDWVTFWEPCTREVYHMPRRYTEKKAAAAKEAAAKAKKKALAVVEDVEDVPEDEEEAIEENKEELWTDEVPDISLSPEDIEGLPTIGRTPKAKVKVAKKGESDSKKMQAQLMGQRERLSIAPVKKLLDPEETLVDWLPYHSIEVVFNMDNVWANHQHHHPACILYDVDDTQQWAPLLKNEEEKQKFKIDYIKKQVQMDPVMDAATRGKKQTETITEMEENMRLNRRNRGLDSFFDKSEKMVNYVDKLLEIHELMRCLDTDAPMCPLFEKGNPEESWSEDYKYVFKLLSKRKPFNKWGSAFQHDTNYVEKQKEGWKTVLNKVSEFRALSKTFPSRRGKGFDGFPVHFSTADRDEMRKHLMNEEGYTTILEDKQVDTFFVVHCRMWGFLDQIPSVWLYFGSHRPSKRQRRQEAPAPTAVAEESELG